MASFKYFVILILPLLQLVLSESETNYSRCGTDKQVLLKALFETGRNLFELDEVFSPPNDPTSRYIKVKYNFTAEDGSYKDNCTVTYIWAVGGFLLAQPPQIFRFTSLLFSTESNNLEFLNLMLPYACRSLIKVTNPCTCKKDKDDLKIFTKQVCL